MVEAGVVFDRETLKRGCFLIFWIPKHWHVADRLVRYKGEIYGDGFNLQTAMMMLLMMMMMIIIIIIIIITMTIIVIWWCYWWWWWWWWRWSYFFSWFDPIHWIGTDSMDPFRREYFRHHNCAQGIRPYELGWNFGLSMEAIINKFRWTTLSKLLK